MKENKCCGNSSSSYAKDMDSFCVREFLQKFEVCNEDSDHHTRIINGWTEITSRKISEIENLIQAELLFPGLTISIGCEVLCWLIAGWLSLRWLNGEVITTLFYLS